MKEIAIAESMGIKLFTTRDHYVSFFNSPYYSHSVTSAIDIYPNSGLYEEQALSPVDGKVVMVREVHPPEPKSFKASTSDWLIFIRSKDGRHLGIRVLHVKPEVRVGDRIDIGDVLGRHIRSGYFNFWTGPHIHVEIRDLENPLRAKGGYPLTPINNTALQKYAPRNVSNNPNLKIDLLDEEYLIVNPDSWIGRIGGFWGFACKIGEEIGLLDGGLPHYGRCGVHLNSTERIERGDLVKIGNLTVGTVTEKAENYALFKCFPIRTSVNTLTLRGLSLYLHLKRPQGFKVVPYAPGYTLSLKDSREDMIVKLE